MTLTTDLIYRPENTAELFARPFPIKVQHRLVILGINPGRFGHMNLFQAAQETGVRHIVFASSIQVLGGHNSSDADPRACVA